MNINHSHTDAARRAGVNWSALVRQVGGRAMAGIARPLRRLPRPARGPAPLFAMPLPLRDVRVHGEALYHGTWLLAGMNVATGGRIVFDVAEAPQAWLRELHRFDWIFGLLTSRHRLWVMMARTLVMDWLERARGNHLPDIARHPATAARRLVNLTAAAPALLAQEDAAFHQRLLAGLNMLARQLLREAIGGLNAADRLEVVMARLWASLALNCPQRQRQHLLQQLGEELRRQFLPDGGHVSRSPAVLLDIMGTLLPLRTALDMAGMEPTDPLMRTVEKALPMLRLFQHADHGLALFQGGRSRQTRLLSDVLAQDAAAGAPLDHAPHSGYARLARGASVLIADVGAPPPPQHFPTGALSALGIEFSNNGTRIFTSCGAPMRPHEELDMATRLSAAHCLPLLNDEDAGVLMDNVITRLLADAPLAAGPDVAAQVRAAEEGIRLEAAHEAWAGRHGFITRRKVFLSSDGRDLRGEDTFEPAAGATRREVPFTIRFHLHPAARPSMSRDGRSVLIVLPDRSAWTFGASGARLALEESLFMADEQGIRRTMQIVLHGTCPTQGCRVGWRLHRSDVKYPRAGAGGRKARASTHDPALPL